MRRALTVGVLLVGLGGAAGCSSPSDPAAADAGNERADTGGAIEAGPRDGGGGDTGAIGDGGGGGADDASVLVDGGGDLDGGGVGGDDASVVVDGGGGGTDAAITACLVNDDCNATDYCAKPDGMCTIHGTCTPRPPGRECTSACVPECGCDGVSYINACTRAAAGASLLQVGACPGLPAPCAP